MFTDVRLHRNGELGTGTEGDSPMLSDATPEVLFCLANVDSIAAIALILVYDARHTVNRHLILHLESASYGVHTLVDYTQSYLRIVS